MIDLNRYLERWVGAGIITAEQAALMRGSIESGEPIAGIDPGEAHESRIPVITEILGYVGAALAIWAVVFLVSEFWGNLADWAQASLFAVVALVLFAGGAGLLSSAEPALRRLSSVLWAGCVVALGGTLYVVFDPIGGLDIDATWSLIGVIATIVAAVMLWKQPSVAQHTVLFAGALTAIVSLLNYGSDPELFVSGIVVWGFGLVWILVSRSGVLTPLYSGMVLGAAAMFVGAQMTVDDSGLASAGVLLGLGTAALFAVAGIVMRDKLTIIVGGVGIFWYVPQAMFEFFGETFGGMLGVFITGMLIVGIAVWFGRHREAL